MSLRGLAPSHQRDFVQRLWDSRDVERIAKGKRPAEQHERRADTATEEAAYRAALEHEFAKRIGLDEYPE